VTDTESKAILRTVARRLGVPESICAEREKRGLAVPWNQWKPTTRRGSRGAWDRSGFAAIMRDAWRQGLRDREAVRVLRDTA
jgi:hypothetical protein